MVSHQWWIVRLRAEWDPPRNEDRRQESSILVSGGCRRRGYSDLSCARALHAEPELSFKEHRTTERLLAAAEELGLTNADGVSVQRLDGTGLSIRIRGRDAGSRGNAKTVAVRGDIDALPIQEATDCKFASTVPNVMHACGHDVHATWAMGAAALLAREPAAGDAVIVLQPAEETGMGAAKVLESGVLDDVDVIYGAHVDPRWVVGEVVVQSGPVAAATDEFAITLRGAGGHGARPQLGRDPTVAAAALVLRTPDDRFAQGDAR